MIELTDAAISKAIEKTKNRSRRDIRLSVPPSGVLGISMLLSLLILLMNSTWF